MNPENIDPNVQPPNPQASFPPQNPQDPPASLYAAPLSPQQPNQPIPSANPYPPNFQNPMPPPSPGGNKKYLIIGIVVVLVLIIGGSVGALMLNRNNEDTNTSNTSSNPKINSGKEEPAGDTTKLDDLSDLAAICKGGSVSAASAYTGSSPHPIALLTPSLASGEYISSSIYFKDQSWKADYKEPKATQLVGCFERKSEKLITKCQFEKASIDYYSVTYSLTIYEAKTGNKLATKQVSSTDTKCPVFASYSEGNPKIYSFPDENQTMTAIQPYVTKQ